jgi:hypothetical protein
MKKIFTLLAFVLGTTLFSQTSFTVHRMNGLAQTVTVQTIGHGDLITRTVTAAPTATDCGTGTAYDHFYIKIINTSSVQTVLTVTRTITLQTPTLTLDGGNGCRDTYYCFGGLCFGSDVNVAPAANNTTLGASGSTVSPYDNTKQEGIPFVIYLNEGITTVGQYDVKYTIANTVNASDSLSFTVRYNSFLNVNENSNVIENVTNVYPSPSSNVANINLTLAQESPVKLQVYNSLGALVYNGLEQKLSGKNKLSVDCSSFSSGLYFVTISAGDSKITKRLVVNK